MIQFKTPNHNEWEAEILNSDAENCTYTVTRVKTDASYPFSGAASFEEYIPISGDDQKQAYLICNAACLYERKERYGE